MASFRGLLAYLFRTKATDDQQSSLGDRFASLDSSDAGKIKTPGAPEIVPRSLLGDSTSPEARAGAVIPKDVIMLPASKGPLNYVDKATQTYRTDVVRRSYPEFPDRMSILSSGQKREDRVLDTASLAKETASPTGTSYPYNRVPAPNFADIRSVVKDPKGNDREIQEHRLSKTPMPDIEECHQSMLSLFQHSSDALKVKFPPLRPSQASEPDHHRRTASVSSELDASSPEGLGAREAALQTTMDDLKKNFDSENAYDVELCSTDPVMAVASIKKPTHPDGNTKAVDPTSEIIESSRMRRHKVIDEDEPTTQGSSHHYV